MTIHNNAGKGIYSDDEPTMKLSLEKAVKKGADLTGANLSLQLGLVGANLKKAKLQNANFAGSNLFQADLRKADLRGAIFTDCILEGANLEGARMDGITYYDIHAVLHTFKKKSNNKFNLLNYLWLTH
jgi:uncharacterized protein YjbI with pentapeptide repeats